MRSYSALAFAALLLFTFQAAHAQGTGTLTQLPQWSGTTTPSSAITQTTYGKGIKITGLTTGQCLTLDSNNLLTTTACGSSSTSLATSTPWTADQLVQVVDNGTVKSVATSSLYSGTTGQLPYFSATDTLTATSSIFLATSGNVGIGATSPQALLHLSAANPIMRITQTDDTSFGAFNFYENSTILNAFQSIGSNFSTVDRRNAFELAAFNGGPLILYTAATPGSAVERMRITGAGNIGIGTSTPSQLLSVHGNGLFSGDLSAANITATGTLTVTGGITSSGALTGTHVVANSASATSTFAGGLNVESGGFVYDYQTNKVGIGTASPSQKLTVNGNASVLNGNELRFYNSGNTNWSQISSPASGAMQFNTGGVTGAMYLTSTGNVGIGTTTPSAKLDVNGTIAWGSSTAQTGLLSIDTNNDAKITYRQGVNGLQLQPNSGDTNGLLTLKPSGSATNSVIFLTSTNSDTLTNTEIFNFGGGFSGAPTGTWSFGSTVYGNTTATSRPIAFVMGGSTGRIEMMRITTAGVGIGTTTPWGQLSASTTSATAPALLAEQKGAGPSALFLGGNVGIGTTTPGRLLTVATDSNAITVPLRITNESTGNTVQTRLEFKAGTATSIFTQFGSGHSTSASLFEISSAGSIAAVAAGTEIARFTNTAVGIGTTSPTRKLSVSDDGTYSAYFSGRVGVGTDAPGQKLVVSEPTNANVALSIIGRGGNSLLAQTVYATLDSGGSSAGGSVGHNGTNLVLAGATSISGRSDLVITSGGLVGIGSTTPSALLSVGTAGAGLMVDSTGKIVARDVTNAWEGRVTPTRSLVLSSATTTTWTASTTGSSYSPYIVAPFAGTLRQFQCSSNSFLGVNVQVAGSSVTPSYVVASSTVGTVNITAGGTFTKGQKISADFGTTTTAAAGANVSCTVTATEDI